MMSITHIEIAFRKGREVSNSFRLPPGLNTDTSSIVINS